jgi:hypothetical protein
MVVREPSSITLVEVPRVCVNADVRAFAGGRSVRDSCPGPDQPSAFVNHSVDGGAASCSTSPGIDPIAPVRAVR